MITHPIYSYSLCVALPLMLFFGFYFIFAPVPDKAIFSNYLRSRRVMGSAVLLLAANYAVHFFAEIRFQNVDAAIVMNLSTYFLCYWLFSSALTTFLIVSILHGGALWYMCVSGCCLQLCRGWYY